MLGYEGDYETIGNFVVVGVAERAAAHENVV